MSNTVTITFTNPDGDAFPVEATVGKSLMEAAVMNNVPGLEGECGGSCSCATCHVFVPADLSGPSDMEDAMLEGTAAPRSDLSRLACQIAVSETMQGITIQLPEEQ